MYSFRPPPGMQLPTTQRTHWHCNLGHAATYGDGSVTGAGGNPPQSTYNTSSLEHIFQDHLRTHMIINGNYGSSDRNLERAPRNCPCHSSTGPPSLTKLFAGPCRAIADSALSQSREYNLAQIHVLLSDDPAELPGGAADTNNIRLANVGGKRCAYAIHRRNPRIPMASGNYAWGRSERRFRNT